MIKCFGKLLLVSVIGAGIYYLYKEYDVSFTIKKKGTYDYSAEPEAKEKEYINAFEGYTSDIDEESFDAGTDNVLASEELENSNVEAETAFTGNGDAAWEEVDIEDVNLPREIEKEMKAKAEELDAEDEKIHYQKL